ncbi:MAG: FecR family protein [Pseudomonadota bacterium]
MQKRIPQLFHRGPAALVLGWGLAVLPLTATAEADCAWRTITDPVRQVITCGTGLTVEREADTAITLFERAGDDPPSVIEISNGAILIEVQPGSLPTQIRTPHAIAAVRGTTYVVDARGDSTSVFVIEGVVSVSKSDAATEVTLEAGEGIDVFPDFPLETTQWSADKANDLLARFGR